MFIIFTEKQCTDEKIFNFSSMKKIYPGNLSSKFTVWRRFAKMCDMLSQVFSSQSFDMQFWMYFLRIEYFQRIYYPLKTTKIWWDTRYVCTLEEGRENTDSEWSGMACIFWSSHAGGNVQEGPCVRSENGDRLSLRFLLRSSGVDLW